jgi:hypothetical protein
MIGFRITGFKVYDSITGHYFEVRKEFGRSLTPELVKVSYFSVKILPPSSLAWLVSSQMAHTIAKMSSTESSNNSNCYCNGSLSKEGYHFRLPPFSEACVFISSLSFFSWSFYCSSLLIIYESERYVPVHVGEGGKEYQVKKDDPHFLEDCEESNEMASCSSSSPQRLDHSQFLAVRDEKVEVKMIDHAHTLPNLTQSVDESYLYSLQSLISHLEEIYSDIRSQKLIEIDPNLAPSLRKGKKS